MDRLSQTPLVKLYDYASVAIPLVVEYKYMASGTVVYRPQNKSHVSMRNIDHCPNCGKAQIGRLFMITAMLSFSLHSLRFRL